MLSRLCGRDLGCSCKLPFASTVDVFEQSFQHHQFLLFVTWKIPNPEMLAGRTVRLACTGPQLMHGP